MDEEEGFEQKVARERDIMELRVREDLERTQRRIDEEGRQEKEAEKRVHVEKMSQESEEQQADAKKETSRNSGNQESLAPSAPESPPLSFPASSDPFDNPSSEAWSAFGTCRMVES